jgi:hypothetical protein
MRSKVGVMAGSTPAAPGRIFITYRRTEADFPASWLYERLADRFGGGQVFKDVDSIEPGEDVAEVIADAVGSCDVLLVLIGDRWLTITDEDGKRRLDDPGDLVRLEIEAALERNVRVVPILVGHAKMPRAEQLPASLGMLARRQALELNPNRFKSDLGRLLRVLERTLEEEPPRHEPEEEPPRREPEEESPRREPEVPAAPVPASPPAGSGQGRRRGRSWRPRPRRLLQLAAVLLVAVVLVGGVGLLTARRARAEGPDLAGSDTQTATDRLGRSSLAYDIRWRPDAAPKGTVLDTAPPAGTRLARGAVVVVWVSSGPKPAAVPSARDRPLPNLAGEPAAAAERALRELGLRPVLRRRSSAVVPADRVISTSPPAGEPVARGGNVVVLVSTGPAPTASTGGQAPPPTGTPPPTPIPTPEPSTTEPLPTPPITT